MMNDAARTTRRTPKVARVCAYPRVAFCWMAPVLLAFPTGCADRPRPNLASINSDWKGPTTQGLLQPAYDPDVLAVCDPPAGWTADPLKSDENHTHKVWRSPNSVTAYGVIHFKMPFPAGSHIALSVFLQKMKKSEGEATLLSQADDPNLPGIRFVADGGRYQIRTNLIVDGWEGWAIYAGTLRNAPINQKELDMAVSAREHTGVGQPDVSGK
jgi:hypothetical protein